MNKDVLNGMLQQRLNEAIAITLDKCVKEQRLTKENFDKTFNELYKEVWDNFEFIRSKAAVE